MNPQQAFEDYQQAFSRRFECELVSHLPPKNTAPQRLHEAMHYTLSVGGKRLRPLLVVLMCERLSKGNPTIDPMPAAVAIECIHTYSLVHDDLPAMDNSPLRRGKPSCHAQFDEATAILTGDALLTYAFELLSQSYAPTVALPLIRELSIAAGSRYLIGGQMEDILAESLLDVPPEDAERLLQSIERGKTAGLIWASLGMGGILAGAEDQKLQQLKELGECLGMGFQVADDLLDVVGDVTAMGKPHGQDTGKLTYLSLYGLEKTKHILEQYRARSLEMLALMGLDGPLEKGLVHAMLDRNA